MHAVVVSLTINDRAAAESELRDQLGLASEPHTAEWWYETLR